MPPPVGDRSRSLPLGALLSLAGICLLLSGWLHDDAYISFRVIDNWRNGQGLRWNVVERVQAYTHPLWLLTTALLTPLTGSPPAAAILLSLAANLATLWLIARRLASSSAVAQVAILVLLGSKAFLDFAVSGLEDPLTRLLVVAFALEALRRDADGPPRPFRASALAALGTLSRPDAALVFAPTLLRLAFSSRAAAGRIIAGMTPLAAWGGFALVYYGTPFPNTAYAKLGLGVPRTARLEQGLVYLLESLARDPLTLLTVGVAVAVAAGGRRSERLLAGGAGAYLAYVVWIGGDYMTGRLLALPFTLGVALLAHRPPRFLERVPAAGIAAAVAILLLPRLVFPFFGPQAGLRGIDDQRQLLHPYTGLVNLAIATLRGGEPWPDHSYRFLGEAAARRPPAVEISGAIGMQGYYAGPKLTIIDAFALTDPLLARLPAVIAVTADGEVRWRPGHLLRPMPAGYPRAIVAGPGHLDDPDLRRYYAALWAITRDPLWSRERLELVRDLHLGRLDPHRDAWVARHPQLFVRRLRKTPPAPSPPRPRATP